MSADVTGATPAAPAPAPAVPNPHPASVQPAPAGVPNPLTGQPIINVYGGNQAPTGQAPVAPATITPAPAMAAPTADQMVPIPLAQLQAFTSIQARLADMEARQRAADDANQRELQNAMLAKGQAEDAVRLIREQSEQSLNAERQRVADTQRQAQNYAIDVEVARSLAGHNFVNAKARRQFEAEVRAELAAAPEGHTFAVRTATFQTAEQLVAAKIATGEYNFMLAPTGVGGTATGQATQSGPAPAASAPAAPKAPENFSEWFIGAAASGQLSSVHVPTDMARLDPSKAMGLRAVR